MNITNLASNASAGETPIDASRANADLRHRHPADIAAWALSRAQRPVVSTNFRPLAAGLLHMVARVAPQTPVLWVDSGYNTAATYEFAERLTRVLELNLQVYTPRMTVARRTAVFGGVPDPDEPAHAAFTREVKLEPFERALVELQPDVWLTGIRHDQTEFRRTLDIVTRGPHGMVRVAPLFHWSDIDLEGYIYTHGLPDNEGYFDPTKVRDDRECGLQTLT